MKKPLLTLLTLFTLLIYDCEKDRIINCTELGCLVFEGTVTDFIDHTAIDGAYVEIIHRNAGLNILFTSPQKLVGQSETDEDGFFRISFSGEPFKVDNGFFNVVIYKNKFITREHTFFSIDSTNFDIPITIDSGIFVESEVDLKINTGGNVRDFEYSIVKDYHTAYKYLLFDSSPIDTTYTYVVGGNRFTVVSYKYKKYGNTYQNQDSVFIAGGAKEELVIDI